MANEINGADVQLYVESATPGTYNRVGGQRGLDLGNTRAEIDVSSKDQPEEKTLPGRLTREFSFEGVYSNSQAAAPDQGYLDLKAAFDNGTKVNVQVWEDNPTTGTPTAILQGSASILDMSESHPDQEASTVSVRGKVDGWGAPT